MANDDDASAGPSITDSLPALPAQSLRRPLTPPPPPPPMSPSPSASSPHTPDDNDDVATSKSPFFQRLPAELRRMILVAAFGARVVHMDLIFATPLEKRKKKAKAAQQQQQQQQQPDDVAAHGGLLLDRSGRRVLRRPRGGGGKGDEDVEAWRWWGCVCHRNPPPPSSSSSPLRRQQQHRPGRNDDEEEEEEDGKVPLWKDGCTRGWAPACERWPGALPDRCRVGAMGWLRACRRAYAEGVDVLYATNTLHVASMPLLLHMPRLLLPRARERVAAVELKWDLHRQGMYPVGGVYEGSLERTFGGLVEAVPVALPNVRGLYLSVTGGLVHVEPGVVVGEVVDEVERMLFGRVDGMVARLFGQRLRECTVEVPSGTFDALAVKTRGETFPWSMRRFWRPLLLPAAGDESGRAGVERGYWVKRGQEIAPLACMAF
ncbi:uncharacterized protein BKCO1_340006 [Diplodia corticola]|uniref:DUF7730 domain-containing protein n=1 Tax=Diplodia corticola TaxID=236234 RepID=A0A1J9QY92_9PEZI|nr:uncharacterized protein BKCO1_340006 [Diplodia corticola]OJD32970.1 hypothetical protein BKCO1_340006 [Diplodia corticola]